MAQLLRTAWLTLLWLVAALCLCVLLSALLPIVPWVRIYLADIVPNHAPWLVMTCLACLLAAALSHRRRGTGVTRALLGVSAIASIIALWVTAHLLYVADSNGARIDLLQTLSWRKFGENAGPDESHIYSRPAGEALWLDVYRGRKAADGAPNPVLFVVHGGGFSSGKRTFGAANFRWYADRGWTVISVDYRLARLDRPTWNLATRDIECALAWTALNARPLGVDLKRLTLNGPSAGGTLAMGAAYAADTERTDPQCGPHVPHVAAVIVKVPLVDAIDSWNRPRELRGIQRSVLTRYFGGTPAQYPQRYAALNPARYLDGHLPPTLIIAAADDPLVPPEGAAEFAAKAHAARQDVRRIVFPYAGHDFNTTFGGIPNQALRQIVLKFLDDHGGPKPTPAAAP
jgi:acetyl esterase/lipase